MPELADILRLHGPAYLAKHRKRLLPSHRRAIQDLSACRTEALGGHLYRCPQCQQEHYQYHSCKNRHCPKCQHVYALLFQASQQALQTLAADPKYVGGTLGMIGVLQSWTRDLRYHPHVHYLIPGGGLSSDGHTWRQARSNFLLPEKPLARIFRAKFRDRLKKAGLLDQVPPGLWRQDWVVDILAVGNGEAALKYLAPYVFRVAISNRNLLDLTDGQVTFRYRCSQTNTTQATTLPAEQFIGRFLQHVLPRGFQKVRTYGLLHPKHRHRFQIVTAQLQPARPQPLDPSPASLSAPQQVSRRSLAFLCPCCACEMTHIREIRSRRGPP